MRSLQNQWNFLLTTLANTETYTTEAHEKERMKECANVTFLTIYFVVFSECTKQGTRTYNVGGEVMEGTFFIPVYKHIRLPWTEDKSKCLLEKKNLSPKNFKPIFFVWMVQFEKATHIKLIL